MTERHWSENYMLIANPYEDFYFTHVPSGTILLITQRVSLETLNGLMREFDTFGTIRDNWRAWWAERDRLGPNGGPVDEKKLV